MVLHSVRLVDTSSNGFLRAKVDLLLSKVGTFLYVLIGSCDSTWNFTIGPDHFALNIDSINGNCQIWKIILLKSSFCSEINRYWEQMTRAYGMHKKDYNLDLRIEFESRDGLSYRLGSVPGAFHLVFQSR